MSILPASASSMADTRTSGSHQFAILPRSASSSYSSGRSLDAAAEIAARAGGWR